MQLLPQGLPLTQCGAWPELPVEAVEAVACVGVPDEWNSDERPLCAGADDAGPELAAAGHLMNLWVVGSLHLVAASADIAETAKVQAARIISERFIVVSPAVERQIGRDL